MGENIKQEKFIKKAFIKHNDIYDYSLINYKSSRIKVKIICKKHGIFEQEPASHLRGQGCPMCSGVKRTTNDDFIKKANKVHNDIYDYSLVKYKNNKTKVKVICKEHGIFETRPDNHINSKSGCPKCANNILYTTAEFIEKANKIHNNKYNYDKVDYKNGHKKIIINCMNHGIFLQKPSKHLQGDGCSKCSGKYKYTTAEFIEKANKIHNNRYKYTLTNYINNYTKINIICPEHGVFTQNPNSHLQGFKCPMCYNEKRVYNTEKFIELAKNKHNNLYDYSLSNYKHSTKKVKIICPEHGIFIQNAGSHINGTGCPFCKLSKGEKEIKIFLEKKIIFFKSQFIFNECKDERNLPFDFYLPEYNICIEYDGLQHFKPIEYFGGKKTFKSIQKHDNIKNEYCKNNNINLIRIKYNENIIEKLEKYF